MRASAPAIALGIAIAGIWLSGRVEPGPQLWQSCAGLTDADMTRVAAGGIVAKSLSSPERRETAVAGGVRIDVPIDFFVKRFRDIVAFKRSEMVLQIGRFSSPPSLADVAGLTFDQSDLEALRRCRVGNCAWKLPAAAIERFGAPVDWNAANWRDQATVIGRRLLVENTLDYLERGDAAIAPVTDRRKPVDASAEFRALLDNLGCDRAAAPRVLPVSRRVPTEQTGGGGRLRLLVEGELRHEAGHQPDACRHAADSRPRGRWSIATKGLLANHYLDASLGLTLLFPAGTDVAPTVNVVYVNRSRADALGGFFGGLTRAVVSSRQRDGTVNELRALKGRLEAGWREAPENRRTGDK